MINNTAPPIITDMSSTVLGEYKMLLVAPSKVGIYNTFIDIINT